MCISFKNSDDESQQNNQIHLEVIQIKIWAFMFLDYMADQSVLPFVKKITAWIAAYAEAGSMFD